MFEKFSGFFKRFGRRRKKQSGETTIMDAKESGMGEFGMDEGFGDLGDLEQSSDKVGTTPFASGTGGSDLPFSDSDFETGSEDISTGGSDFDARTISDEISGADMASMPEAEAEVQGILPEAEEPLPFGGPGEAEEVEPTPVSPVKRVVTLVVAVVIAIIVGGAFQLFLWPMVAQKVGLVKSEVATLDIQAQLKSEQQKNLKLKAEVAQFKGLGSPAEVKGLQQKLTQVRDSQGPMQDVENKFNAEKEKEAAYDELVKKVDGIQADIGKTQSDIGDLKSQISAARIQVTALARQTDEEFARFRVELARAEVNQRFLIELQMADNRGLRADLDKLQQHLTQLSPAIEPEAAPQSSTEPTSGVTAEVVPQTPSETVPEGTAAAPEAPSEATPENQTAVTPQAPESQPEAGTETPPEAAHQGS
jgi:hypothetical protein